jgi:3-hydroxyacyl-CoA dehydrogenase
MSGVQMAEVLVGDETSAEAMATVLSVVRRCGRSAIQARGLGVAPALKAAMDAAAQALDASDKRGQVVLKSWGLNNGTAARCDLTTGDAGRVLGAMANAGLYLLGEGKALRPSDIDLVALRGLGLPRHIGGPMFWASRRGLLVLRNDLQNWAEELPDLYTPAPLIDELIRDGIHLEALNED